VTVRRNQPDREREAQAGVTSGAALAVALARSLIAKGARELIDSIAP
jgi:hypothetical protein